MNYYNIYYKEKRLNNRPLTEEDLRNIKSKKNIYKRNPITNELDEISVNNICPVKVIFI